DAMPASCLDAATLDGLRTVFGRPATARDIADLDAMTMERAEWTPAHAAVSGCVDPGLDDATRRHCIALLGRVATGDTLIDQLVALSALIRLHPAGVAQDALRERYRQVQWLGEQGATVPPDAGFIARRIADGEVAAIRGVLQARGDWPAPDGWLPAGPDARALIVTGRPAERAH
ncbi:MAG TPA: hypothetical protein VLK29_11305, partial [Luteimonas sp.]|nr:hypothetical protein [Luteimonas sp.]